MKDRQVQHNFRESRHQCSSCPNFACHKCLARESNPRHLCSKQSILPLDHHSRIKLELGNSNDILQARNLSSSCKPQPCSQVLLWQGTGPLTVQGLSKLGKLSRSLGDPVRIPRVLQPDFVFRGYKVHVVWFLVKDRQVQHNFRESRHQCSSCPNFACHKCLARESNPIVLDLSVLH